MKVTPAKRKRQQTKEYVIEDGKEIKDYTLHFKPGDSMYGREILGTCRLSDRGFMSLFGAIIERLVKTGNSKKIKDLLALKNYTPDQGSDTDAG